MILGIPEAWKATRGKGVKVAILDSGADLTHPALLHLEKEGRLFWATDLGVQQVSDMTDARPRGNNHGTRCLSILAANDVENLMGVCADAVFYIIRVADSEAAVWHRAMVKALQKAVDLEVDIIITSVTPRRFDPAPETEVASVFAAIAAKNIALVTTLRNREDVDDVNEMVFPSTRTEAIVVGSLTDNVLQQLQAGGKLHSSIGFVMPRKLQVQTCTSDKTAPNTYMLSDCPSSFANAAFGGVVALLIAHWRATEGAAYVRRSKADLLAALFAEAAVPLHVSGMLQVGMLQFYKNL